MTAPDQPDPGRPDPAATGPGPGGPPTRAPHPTVPPPAPGAPASDEPAPPPPPELPPRPRLLDALVLPIWVLLGQVLGSLLLVPVALLSGGMGQSQMLVWAVVLGWATVVIGTALWLRLRRTWRRAWHAGHRPRSTAAMAGIGVAGALVGFVIVQLVSLAAVALTGTEPPEQEVFELLQEPGVALAVGATAVLVAPAIEEIIFRGVLQDVLARRMGWHGAAVLQALIFSAIHLETLLAPAMLLAIGSLGYLFVWLRRWTGSLIAPIAAHLVFNLISVSLTTLVG